MFSLGGTDPRLYFIHYIDNRRSGEFRKGRLVRPMRVLWKKRDEIPNGLCIRELLSLIGAEAFGMSAGNRDKLLGQQLSAVPELFDSRVR